MHVDVVKEGLMEEAVRIEALYRFINMFSRDTTSEVVSACDRAKLELIERLNLGKKDE